MANTNHLGALAAVAEATLVAVGLLVLMMLVVEVRPAEATFPGKNGRIAYVCSGGICTINPGGGGKTKITPNKGIEGGPSYSPNGKKIAYSTFDEHDPEIFTINATGGKPFQVTHNSRLHDGAPSYSPGGKRIAYEHDDGHDLEIFTINATGGKPFQLTDNKMDDFHPDYSPDGKKIAYVSSETNMCFAPYECDSEIFTIPVSGGSRFNVTNNKTEDSEPSYSPDGKRIAYVRVGGGVFPHEIYTINAGGGRSFKVTNHKGGSAVEPSYSLDGKKIVFAAIDGARPVRPPQLEPDMEIYTVNVSGGGEFKVTNNKTDDFAPSWGSRP